MAESSEGAGDGASAKPELRLLVHWHKAKHSIDLSEVANIADVKAAIEDVLSVPKTDQKIICGGRTWQGLAFPDDLELVQAAGKAVKMVDDIKTIEVMLMAPASFAQAVEELDKLAGKIEEAKAMLKQPLPDDPAAARRVLLTAEDLFVKAQTGLDSLRLVGKHRARRRALLEEAEALCSEVDKRKAKL